MTNTMNLLRNMVLLFLEIKIKRRLRRYIPKVPVQKISTTAPTKTGILHRGFSHRDSFGKPGEKKASKKIGFSR